MTNELLPCPFCGNEPTLYQDEMTGHWAVRCVKDTHRPTVVNSHGATAWGYSCTDPAEAIAAWNTRAERTCKMELDGTISKKLDVWFCDECGSPTYNDMMPSFCQYCGAKVVSE